MPKPSRRGFLAGAASLHATARWAASGLAAPAAVWPTSQAQPSNDPSSSANESAQATALATPYWVSSTQTQPWVVRPLERGPAEGHIAVSVRPEKRHQIIEGFGACFNELGWVALSRLSNSERARIFEELFSPAGAALNICRMPIGANDFARDWYAYDEHPGDFSLRHFSIENDHETLIPFIRAAQAVRPDLRLWASPWSPPSWMKINKHYAQQPSQPHQPDNGLDPHQAVSAPRDAFIQKPRYLRAYAHYFKKFVEAYRAQGINIAMVMPQNEFNSAQVFPSCLWTPKGLARFIRVLGPQMKKLGVDVFLGTIERADASLVEGVMRDPLAARFVDGFGFQWAGRGAVAQIARRYPRRRIYQTEQECGDGKNDWRFCRYAWKLMRHYLSNGSNAYNYWNIALDEGGVSRWGWEQNSLITVDPKTNSHRFNHEFYLLKHFSGFVKPGAHRIATESWHGYVEQLAFENPDGTIVIVAQNDLNEPLPISFQIGNSFIRPTLPADSFNTFMLPPA